MSETVGFVGLGSMGVPMARNLLLADFNLRVWNRSPGKTKAFADAGAIACESPGETAHGADFVITMLSDDRSVEEITTGDEGILTALAPDAIHLSMTTIGPETARRLSVLHDLHDAHYLSAPTFGRPEAAILGALNILLSGANADVRARVEPVLLAMGQKVWDFGDEPGAACVVKLCGNLLVMSATAAMAEAFTLAEKSGVDRHEVYTMLTQSIFNVHVYQSNGRMIAAEDYSQVGFSLPLSLKDVCLVTEIGRQTATPLPLASLIEQKLTASFAKGRGHLDATAFALEASEAAGLRRDDSS